MSSNDFVSIFNHAAGIVRIRLSHLKGCDEVIESIRSRINTDVRDPRSNRELFIEPLIDSQQLCVPAETAEEVSRELHQLSVLRLWTRLRCPDVGSDEDGTIIETDSEDELRASLGSQCPQCGSHHELVPALVETVYAPNFPISQNIEAFDSARLRLESPSVKISSEGPETHVNRTAAVANVDPKSIESFLTLLSLALSTNTALEAVPSAVEVWLGVWKGPAVILLTYLCFIGPITWCAGQTVAILVSLVVLAVIWLVLRGEVHAKLAPSALQRQVTRWGICMSVGLVTAGTTGVEVSFKDEHRLTVPIWQNKTVVLPIKLEYGATNPWLIGAGLLCFVFTLTFVFLYDRHKGWLT